MTPDGYHVIFHALKDFKSSNYHFENASKTFFMQIGEQEDEILDLVGTLTQSVLCRFLSLFARPAEGPHSALRHEGRVLDASDEGESGWPEKVLPLPAGLFALQTVPNPCGERGLLL